MAETNVERLTAMEVGQSIDFPAEACMSIKSLASQLGFKLNRRYSSRNDRERRVVVITRNA